MRSLGRAWIVVGVLALVSSGARADEAEYVEAMLAQLRTTMGVSPSDPNYCEMSRDLCDAMCERFHAEGVITGSCEMYCETAHVDACTTEE